MRLVVQPDTPHNGDISRRERAQQRAHDVPLPRPLQTKQPGVLDRALEHLDLELAGAGQGVDVRGLRVAREHRVAVADAAVAGGDVAHEAVPGGDGHLARRGGLDVAGDLQGAADGSRFEGVEERGGHG